MKRIGILTYHRATNYGAVLQAYSLINRIKNDFPYEEIELIDYSTKSAKKDHTMDVLYTLVSQGIQKGIEVYKKNIMFCRFSNSLPMSSEKIVSDQISQVAQYMDKHYDIVISGSDAVFSWNGKKFPTSYLLGEDSSYLKFSYAASSHRLFYRDATKQQILYCRKAFRDYVFLGVRDCETEKFVRFCTPESNTIHNCDPTFLLDISAVHKQCGRLDIGKMFGISDERPLIIVMSPDESIGKAIMEAFSDVYSIVSLFVRNRAIPNYCGTLTPFEWASVFQYAKLTITEYFHATILSFLNNTPVVAIDRLGIRTGYEGKIHDLLYTRLNFPESYIDIDEIKEKGTSLIVSLAYRFLQRNNSNDIIKAIETEKQYYFPFKKALEAVISKRP